MVESSKSYDPNENPPLGKTLLWVVPAVASGVLVFAGVGHIANKVFDIVDPQRSNQATDQATDRADGKDHVFRYTVNPPK